MTILLIGVTTARSLDSRGYPQVGVLEIYLKALTMAGACPVLIPLGLPGDWLSEMLPRLNGVLFSGGGDVHPDQYGSKPHPKVNSIDEDRDNLEIQLFKEVVKGKVPFLGICRGMQVINVALGGSLYEDLQDQRSNSLKHDCWPDQPPDFLAHSVKVDGNSRLVDILGIDKIDVNSLHHQGIRELAPDLYATARTPDGLVEAVEIPTYSFGLAVHWHPEWLQGNLAMRALFRDFVEATSRDFQR